MFVTRNVRTLRSCSHCLNITADMSNKKLIPYVDLITRPRRLRARSPETSLELPSPNLSPRKKRRIQENDPLEDNLMKKVCCSSQFSDTVVDIYSQLAEIRVSRPRRSSTTAPRSGMGVCVLIQYDGLLTIRPESGNFGEHEFLYTITTGYRHWIECSN